MQALSRTSPDERLRLIELARRGMLHEGGSATPSLPHWIASSWQRCLARGQRPEQRVGFDALPAQQLRRVEEANHALISVARPILQRLARAIADTRYFAILVNADGVVVDVNGPIDRSQRAVQVITRIGVDLSESGVGTSAIGAALAELQPVWLHRGEHFFTDTSVYSCAGAPLFGPDGRCIGMLDLTGVMAEERPELKHLVAQYARSIEDALIQQQGHALVLRLSWPGQVPGEATDGLLGIDAEGLVQAANRAARDMLPPLAVTGGVPQHLRDLFALPPGLLFDAAQRSRPALDLPLWSGLRLMVLARRPGQAAGHVASAPAGFAPVPGGGQETLKDVEHTLIRDAVAAARGNVAVAARALGISRATVYRKLARRPPDRR